MTLEEAIVYYAQKIKDFDDDEHKQKFVDLLQLLLELREYRLKDRLNDIYTKHK